MPISDLRKEYHHEALNKAEMSSEPLEQFEKWFKEACQADFLEPNAMVLATASKSGAPSSRVVLLKDYDQNGFVFFSNYLSQKGAELKENPQASAVFYWDKLERQLRIAGVVERLPADRSEEYFRARPRDSQLAAAISAQSREIENRAALEKKFSDSLSKIAESEIERPEHWGGFLLKPVRFEFWQGRPNRMHDRIVYELLDGKWELKRLQP